MSDNPKFTITSTGQEYKIIYDLPHGERILINDKKPSGLNTAIAISNERNEFPLINIKIDNFI